MGNFNSIIDSANTGASASENQSAGTILTSIGYGFAALAGQTIVFLLLRDRLTRIYRPKSYLVPERQRVSLPPAGFLAWVLPVFKTSNMTLIQKCGLDAYFFLRYLRMLLKIFIPAGCLILPILLPINSQGGNDKPELNVLNITNIGPAKKGSYYWAHLIMAILFIIWTGYVMYKELRGYIRVRQAYLTSPQHRIRASATTVLVTGIPKRWLTLEALDGLYDVFPGGIRNIWINRNYDELSDKVQKRDKLSKQLESAETNLLKLCQKKHKKQVKSGKKTEKEISREMTPMRTSEQSHEEGHNGQSNISEEQLVRQNVEENIENTAAIDTAPHPSEHISSSKIVEGLTFWRNKTGLKEELDYATPYKTEYDQTNDEESLWRQYITPKDRETMRLPLFAPNWFPALPLVGKKVDRIYHLRSELARLNLEIKTDQKHPQNFPLMNSAFIQFNHQVAAHMACQSVSHHVPLQMAPRLVEISPDDVIWDNLSIKWWEKYIRTLVVLGLSVGLIIFYAIPVTFSAALSNLGNINTAFPAFGFLGNLTGAAKSVIQGIAPPLLLSLILLLVPIIYRLLVGIQGPPTGNAKELGVQQWYFAFLFIQVFLVVSIASGLLTFFSTIAANPTQLVSQLGNSIPQAANYFLSYITLQALSNSASALLQLFTLAIWFLLGPLIDSTPRDKWSRETNLSNVQWGSFFPPFTNFAVIGLVYSVLAPVLIPFVVMVFAFYWIVYRYNVLYVYAFKNDTGGLLFPIAVNQLFVGIYFLSLSLMGIFYVAMDENGNACAIPQGIIMTVVLALTIVYQWLLNSTFNPLLRYMPITLEDDAVLRDEEFARAQASKFGVDDGNDNTDSRESVDIQDQLRRREQVEEDADKAAETKELNDIEARRQSGNTAAAATTTSQDSWHADPTKPKREDRWRRVGDLALKPLEGAVDLTGRAGAKVEQNLKTINEKLGLRTANDKLGQNLRTVNEKIGLKNANDQLNGRIAGVNGLGLDSNDPEAQAAVGDILFSGLADELEDLTPEERDLLVRYAFQHSALRARQPIVWIPRDDLGVSDDEIRRANKFSDHLPMSNTGARLDPKGKVVFEKSPPDFSNIDLISL